MPVFIVDYTHPDPVGWTEHLRPHLDWLAEMVQSGLVLASGPTVCGTERTATLILSCADRAELDAVVASDPYVAHGQVSDLFVKLWDPIFGKLNSSSSAAGRDAPALARTLPTELGI